MAAAPSAISLANVWINALMSGLNSVIFVVTITLLTIIELIAFLDSPSSVNITALRLEQERTYLKYHFEVNSGRKKYTG